VSLLAAGGAALAAVLASVAAAAAGPAGAAPVPFLSHFSTVTAGPSTVPAN